VQIIQIQASQIRGSLKTVWNKCCGPQICFSKAAASAWSSSSRDLPQLAARHIPLTTWFRFRRAIEHTSTILLALEQHPIAGSCSSLLLQLGSPDDPILPAED